MSTTEDPASAAAALLKTIDDEEVEDTGMPESAVVATNQKVVDDDGGGAKKVRELDTEGEIKYPVREVTIKLPFLKDSMQFNWFVSIFGLIVLWGLAGYCMAQPAAASSALSKGFNVVVDYFTWFYIGK
ncbi:MAG: hypothetical protein ACI8RD_012531 [Bacillariaceae sp.]|jgi:hypothetical protein